MFKAFGENSVLLLLPSAMVANDWCMNDNKAFILRLHKRNNIHLCTFPNCTQGNIPFNTLRVGVLLRKHLHQFQSLNACLGNDYRNYPKFSDRYAWANSADPDQTAPRGAV